MNLKNSKSKALVPSSVPSPTMVPTPTEPLPESQQGSEVGGNGKSALFVWWNASVELKHTSHLGAIRIDKTMQDHPETDTASTKGAQEQHV